MGQRQTFLPLLLGGQADYLSIGTIVSSSVAALQKQFGEFTDHLIRYQTIPKSAMPCPPVHPRGSVPYQAPPELSRGSRALACASLAKTSRSFSPRQARG